MTDPRRIIGNESAFHRFLIGTREAAVVSDGPLLLTPPGEVFTTLAPELIDGALRAAFMDGGPMRIEQNVLLVDLDGALALFDNGMGTSQLFGSQAGRLLTSLAEAGVRPDEIDAMVLSHAHPDHCWGTTHDDGRPTFPNATIYMAQEELRFWEQCTDPEMEAVVEGVAKHLAPLRERIRFFRDGEEFLPGVRAMAAPGHTPGHTIFLISSGEERLCVLCDVTFHDPLSYAFPQAASAYDYDKALGARTRCETLACLADQRTRVISYHAPWPGIGHVARAGDAFRYVPAPIIRHEDERMTNSSAA
jgi:glyoxylase-like metal-dependent hydrolase (beta-lactamase superfamily II)